MTPGRKPSLSPDNGRVSHIQFRFFSGLCALRYYLKANVRVDGRLRTRRNLLSGHVVKVKVVDSISIDKSA